MKKSFLTLLILTFSTISAIAQGCPSPSSATASVTFKRRIPGAIAGDFTINGSGDKVAFAQGNLQYDSDEQKWQFAEHQYDYIGSAAGNIYVGTDGLADDKGIADLFGYVGASSTWDTEHKMHGLTSSTATNAVNGYGNVLSENLLSDWGTLMGSSGWRTLTGTEMAYVLNSRSTGSTVNSTSNARYTEATINTDGTSVNGMIIFPDGYDGGTPAGVTWGTINSPSDWGTECTTAGWTALEEAGCVFLPAAGVRNGATVTYAGEYAYYWVTPANASLVERGSPLCFISNTVLCGTGSYPRSGGMSVRLVKDVE